jgi:hypothetical protein
MDVAVGTMMIGSLFRPFPFACDPAITLNSGG